jgi:hypothetical protein
MIISVEPRCEIGFSPLLWAGHFRLGSLDTSRGIIPHGEMVTEVYNHR